MPSAGARAAAISSRCSEGFSPGFDGNFCTLSATMSAGAMRVNDCSSFQGQYTRSDGLTDGRGDIPIAWIDR